MNGSTFLRWHRSDSGSGGVRGRSRIGRAGLVAALVVSGSVVLLPGTAEAATSLNVSTTVDVATNQGACGNSSITTPPSSLSLREAVCLANNLGGSVTINVPAGHYTLADGELQPGKASGQNITINGAGSASTIIDGNNVSRVFDVDPNVFGGVTFSIAGLTITGGHVTSIGGAGILDGSVSAVPVDVLSISNSVISNNTALGSGSPGGGVQMWGGQLTMTNTTVSGNTAQTKGSGVYYQATGAGSPEGLSITGSTFSGNAVVGTLTSGITGGALLLNGVAGSTYDVEDSTFTGNTANSNGSGEQGAGAAIYESAGTLTATGNTFTGNSSTGTGATGAAIYAAGTAGLHYNRITGNSGAGTVTATPAATVDATDNWWGCNAGAGQTGCDTTSGTPTAAPYLKLVASANPSHVMGPNGTATITAALTTDSLGASVGGNNLIGAFNGLPVTFADPPGDATVTATAGAHWAALSSGVASIDYHSNTTLGPDNDTVTLDNATVTAQLEVDEAPKITSADAAAFTLGTNGSFTVTTTGYPTATLTESGALPPGVAFTDNGNGTATLAGTPTAGGTFPITVTAANGYSPNATQNLTISVIHPPAFTSSDTATFKIGTPGTFTITTSGAPTVSSITESGTLPAGINFTDNGDGTATLSGTPTGAGNTYPVTLTATNSVDPDATQSLTIRVDQAPEVTLNPFDQTVQAGMSVTFTAGADGVPAPTGQWQKSTDGGVTFANIPAATGTSYTFSAASGDDGSMYRAVFTNAAGSATTSAATLTVNSAPTFTNADHTTFPAGTAGSFTVTTDATPQVTTVTESGVLPAGVNFTDNGDGTATVSGTPAAGTGGSYPLTLTATNGVLPDATQSFTLTVTDVPMLASGDHATFDVAHAGSFTVTTTPGFPTSTTLTETGGLPSGMTFTDNGDGTATLAGTPAAGTGGPYPITLTATNSAGHTDQSFTLTVREPAAITSADHTTFAVGSAGSFTVTTGGGFPMPAALTESGALPAGVTFHDNGDGTATVAGTPSVGSGGSYPLTITAQNGSLSDATQSFVLTVTELPSITSADHTSFTVGDANDFPVTTQAGYPTTTSLTESGALPSGVTFTDNGDGTATLGGTPDVGTTGSYPLTITATNGSGHVEQAFVLTVGRQAQTITVTSSDPGTGVVGDSYTPAATSDSQLPVSYSIDSVQTTNQACSLSSSVVNFDHAGTCVIDFDQPGNDTYAPAPQVRVTIAIEAIATTTSVQPSVTAPVYGQPVTATATVAGPGSPAGAVQFSVDGNDLGAPVGVVAGQATSPDLGALTPGAHTVGAAFTPTDSTVYGGSAGESTVSVAKAATTTDVQVKRHAITASVAPVAPGNGGPTGRVRFMVGSRRVGTAPVRNGLARLAYTVAPGAIRRVSAIYAGDANFTGSSASTARRDPSITATVRSTAAKSPFGWYRAPVTVRFSCRTNGAALVHRCPAPVTLRRSGAAMSVSRTITATDGGAATVVVDGINIDRVRPQARIAGVRAGKVYAGPAPQPRCVAHDRLSGVASCTLREHTSGQVTRVIARVADRAGNTRTVALSYRSLRIYLEGARYVRGAFNVRPGATYTISVLAARRPRYYDAAVYPKRPGPADAWFHRAGPHRWTLGLTIDNGIRSHPLWDIGVKIGRRLHEVKIRIR